MTNAPLRKAAPKLLTRNRMWARYIKRTRGRGAAYWGAYRLGGKK